MRLGDEPTLVSVRTGNGHVGQSNHDSQFFFMLPRLPFLPVEVEARIHMFVPRPAYIKELKRDCARVCCWCLFAFNKQSRNYVKVRRPTVTFFFCSRCINVAVVRQWVRTEAEVRRDLAVSRGQWADTPNLVHVFESVARNQLRLERRLLANKLRAAGQYVPTLLDYPVMDDLDCGSPILTPVHLGSSDEDVDWKPLYPSRMARIRETQAVDEFGGSPLAWPSWVRAHRGVGGKRGREDEDGMSAVKRTRLFMMFEDQ
jgi:hypothetical protein